MVEPTDQETIAIEKIVSVSSHFPKGELRYAMQSHMEKHQGQLRGKGWGGDGHSLLQFLQEEAGEAEEAG